MTQPAVSVVVIFLNGEAYLREAIDSVLAQRFDDFELIMVDDGSTDASTEIARSYEAAHPGRCVYIEHPGHANRGMSASRNAGIGAARGRYVAFIDADDVWTSEKLHAQVAIFETHPEVGLVAGAARYWWSWQGGADEVIPAGPILDQVIPAGETTTRIYPLGEAQAPCPSVLMVRREVLDKVGGFEASYTGPLQMYEDQAFLAKVYLATSVWFSSSCWLYYRQHADSCVSVNVSAGNYDRIRRHFLDWFETYLKSHHIEDQAILKALRHSQFPYRHPLLYGARMRAMSGAKRVAGKVRRHLRRVV